MNWIKDNLIMLLGGATALLVIGLIIVLANLKTAQAEKETLQEKIGGLEDAVETNAAAAKDSAAKLTAIARQHKLDLARADYLAGEVDKYKARLQEETDKNGRLRSDLRAKDAAIATYLDAGMPRELACLTWPGSCK